MPVPLVLITRFFQLVSERKFAEAERVLERVTEKMAKNENKEFNNGYLNGLRGIVLSTRSTGESDSLLSSLNTDDVGALKKYHKEFLNMSESGLHGDYDRGYFSALAEYARISLKITQNRNKSKLG